MSKNKDQKHVLTQDQKERVKKNRESAFALLAKPPSQDVKAKLSQDVAARALLQLHTTRPVLPAVKAQRAAAVLMPAEVGNVKANVLPCEGRKRKYASEEPSTHLTKSSGAGTKSGGADTKSGDAYTKDRLCHDVYHEFPYGFQYGRNALQLVVCEHTKRAPGSRASPDPTYIFSFCQLGQIVDGSAEVSTTHDIPRLMNFKFDLTDNIKRGIAELALRAIIWFVKLQCPRASQFDNNVFDDVDRHESCTREYLRKFLLKVLLFQTTDRSCELLFQECAPREKIVAFLADRINGRIIQELEQSDI